MILLLLIVRLAILVDSNIQANILCFVTQTNCSGWKLYFLWVYLIKLYLWEYVTVNTVPCS